MRQTAPHHLVRELHLCRVPPIRRNGLKQETIEAMRFPRQKHSALRTSPATSNQSRYVLAELAGAGSYMISVGHFVTGTFDRSRFKAACLSLLQRHEALRTRFEVSDRRVFSHVDEKPTLWLRSTRHSDGSFEAFSAWATPKIFEQVDPRASGSLVRFLVADYGDSWRFTVAGHHAVTDGISRGVINRDLLKLYAQVDLADAQAFSPATYRAKPNLPDQVEQLVKALPLPQRIISERPFCDQSTESGIFEEMKFEGLSKTLRSIAKKSGTTRFSVLAAIYALSLRAISGSQEFSTCFQSEGRKAINAPNGVVGPFSNTLALDLSFKNESPFSDFAQRLGGRVKDALAGESGSVMEMLQSHDRVPTVSLNMFPPAPRIVIDGLALGPREFLDRRTEYDLNLVWSEDQGILTARAFYNPKRLSVERVRVLLRLQKQYMQAALIDPDQSCSDVIATARDPVTACVQWKPVRPLEVEPLHAPVFDHAKQHPEAAAIITSRRRISYGRLQRRALQFRETLAAKGARPNHVVSIIADRSPDLIAAILAVSSCEGQFAVIDAQLPEARIKAILGELRPNFTIRATHADEALDFNSDVDVRAHGTDQDRVSDRVCQEDVAYHLFTSGSTGTPKIVSHSAMHLQRFIRWQKQKLDLPTPISLMVAGLSHDPIMRDIFLPLSYGGCIAIPSDCEIANPARLRDLIRRANVNVLHLTPSMGRLLHMGSQNWSWAAGRAIFWGGEPLAPPTAKEWQSGSIRQFNLYGATETPQAALIHEIEFDTGRSVIPIGSPVPWTHVELLDADGTKVGQGELGEIVIHLSDPVCGTTDRLGNRDDALSKTHYTGDLGYLCTDGNVRFVGRRDTQVNVNGNRIELREIEAAAEAVSGILHACAVMSDGEAPELRLFVIPHETEISEQRIRQDLAKVLDQRTMPQRIMVLDQFPVNKNGKTDRSALSRMNVSESNGKTNRSAPKTEAEIDLAALFGKYTGQSSPSREQSVVDLGCDSLMVIELRLALEDYGYLVPEDWDFMPIRELAKYRTEQRKSTDDRSLFSVHNMDAFVVFRCLAITAIVIHHAGVVPLQGASILLLTLTGFSVGRMQVPAIFNDGKTGRIWAMIPRLLIPVTLVSWALFCVHALRGNDPHTSILTYTVNFVNFINDGILGNSTSQRVEYWLWFLHAYLQIFLIIATLISIPAVFRWLRSDHWRAALVFSTSSQIIAALSMFAGFVLAPDFSSFAISTKWLPTTVMPFIAIGILSALANTPGRRRIAIALILLQFAIFAFAYGIHAEVVWPPILITCLFVSTIRLPRLAYLAVASISTQALMIYLTQTTTIFALMMVFGPDVPIIANTVIALVTGILLGRVLRPVWTAARINQLAEKRIFFGKLQQDSQPFLYTKKAKS